MNSLPEPARIPLVFKVAYTLWIAVWAPTYWMQYGPANFLWLCDAANFLIAVAIWRESPLLFSSQAVSVLLIQAVWMVDFFSALLFRVHPIGGTEYMFDASLPLGSRLMSLFHVFVPVLLVWALTRVGYDRRGWKLQSAIAAVILPLSYLAGNAELNINWLWKVFGVEQTLVPGGIYLLFTMVAYPLVLYLPTHLVLSRLLPPTQPPTQPGSGEERDPLSQ